MALEHGKKSLLRASRSNPGKEARHEEYDERETELECRRSTQPSGSTLGYEVWLHSSEIVSSDQERSRDEYQLEKENFSVRSRPQISDVIEVDP